MGGQRHAPAALPPRKPRSPLCTRLGGPQDRSGQVRNVSSPTRIRLPDRPSRSSRYTDWAIPAHGRLQCSIASGEMWYPLRRYVRSLQLLNSITCSSLLPSKIWNIDDTSALGSSHVILSWLSSHGPGTSVSIATGYGLDGPGIESRWGARFFAPVQTGPGAQPPSCAMGTGSFPGVNSGRGMTLTPHSRLVPWSWKSRAIPLLPLWAVRPVQSLSACTRVHFTLPLSALCNASVTQSFI